MSVPYTYLIGWSKHNKWYYGVQYGKNANPQNIWKSYFTSSKFVHAFAEEHGDPDIVEVRRTFDDQDHALLWESRVLKRMNVTRRDDFLNMCSNPGLPVMLGEHNPMAREDVKQKHLESVNTPEYKKLMSEICSNRTHSEETKKMMSERAKEDGRGKWNKGVAKKESTKKKMSVNATNRPRKQCPHCGDYYTLPNYEKHINSCNGVKKKRYKKQPDGTMKRQ